jgi:excisionase family DNA binding protein
MFEPASPTLKLITSKQAAALTGHSTRTIRRWIEEGKIRKVQLSRRLVVVESDVQALILSKIGSGQVAA